MTYHKKVEMIVLAYLALMLGFQVLVILQRAKQSKETDLNQVRLFRAKILPHNVASDEVEPTRARTKEERALKKPGRSRYASHKRLHPGGVKGEFPFASFDE